MKHLSILALAATSLLAMDATARAAEPVTMDNFRSAPALHQTIDFDDIDYRRLEAAVFLVTNEQRAQHNLPVLAFHPLLGDAARGHAQRMVTHDFYDHTDPTSRAFATPQDRARHAGIRNPAIAENIHNLTAMQYDGGWVQSRGGRGRFADSNTGGLIPAHTYLTFADAVVADWMDSPGHRSNILHREALELGIGARFYWNGDWPQLKVVQNFQLYRTAASSKQATPAPRPAPRKPRSRPEPEPDFHILPVPEPDYQPAPRSRSRRPSKNQRRPAPRNRSKRSGCSTHYSI